MSDRRAILCLICGEESVYFRRFADALKVLSLGGKDASHYYKAVYVGLTRPEGKTAGLWRTAEKFKHCHPLEIKTFDYKWGDDFSAARNFVHEKAAQDADTVVWVDFDDLITPAILIWVRDFWHLQDSDQRQPKVHMSARYLYQRDQETGAPLIVQNKERLVFPASKWRWIAPIHECLSPVEGQDPEPTAFAFSHAGIEHSPVNEVRSSDRNWRIMQQNWLEPFALKGYKGLGTRELYYLCVEAARHGETGLIKALRPAVQARAKLFMEQVVEDNEKPKEEKSWSKAEAWFLTNALRIGSSLLISESSNVDEIEVEEHLLSEWACPIDVVAWGCVLNDLAYEVNRYRKVLEAEGRNSKPFIKYSASPPDGLMTFSPHYYLAMEEATAARFGSVTAETAQDTAAALASHIKALQAGRAEPLDYGTEQHLQARIHDLQVFLAPYVTSAANIDVPNYGFSSACISSELLPDLGGGYLGEFTTGRVYPVKDGKVGRVIDLSASEIAGSGMMAYMVKDLAMGEAKRKRSQKKTPADGLIDGIINSLTKLKSDEKGFDDPKLLEGKPVIAIATEAALETWEGRTVRDFGIGGSESCIIYFAEALAKHGAQVHVFCPTPLGIKHKTNGVVYAPLDRIVEFDGKPFDVFIASRSWRLLERRWAKRQLLWLHDMPVPGQSYDFPNLDEIVVPSAYLARLISGTAKAPVSIIPHGIAYELVCSPTKVKRNKEGLAMLFSSQPERGLAQFSALTMEMRRLYGEENEVEAVALYGAYNYKKSVPDFESWRRLRSWQHQAFLAGVRCTGRVPHYMSFMAAQWANILPYTTSGFKETFGLAPVEAFIAGANVAVSAGCGATFEILEPAFGQGVYELQSYTPNSDWAEVCQESAGMTSDYSVEEALKRMQMLDLCVWEDKEMLRRWGLI